MTSILKDDDKIYTMYRQYKELIHKEAEENDNRVYGTDQMASRLVVAHMLDHVVCLFKQEQPPTAMKVNNTWKEKFGVQNNSSVIGESPITTSTSIGSTTISGGKSN